MFNLFEHPSRLESGKQRQAINKLRGHKIQSNFYVRGVMSLFSSDVFSNTEIIEILIPVTSYYAPSDALVQFLKIFCFFFSKFGNLAEEHCRRNLENVISVTTFIVNFTVFCLFYCYCCFFLE